MERGLPEGTLDWACALAAASAAIGGWLAGAAMCASGREVAAMVWLPELVAGGMRPPAPTPFGGGWLHADLGAPGDAESFQRCLDALPAGATAADAAVAAQSWRLPVCDYRIFRAAGARHPLAASGGPVGGERGLKVVDLSAMWAGPLATRLMLVFGIEVIKVEPAFRPDGFRAHARLFAALNDGKRIVDLDLRRPADMDRLRQLAASGDVVFDTYSPRVMANFGLDGDLEGASRVDMPAFGPGPRRHWVAYGTGVHACSGLGDFGGGRFGPGAISYPDPLGGFTAALALLAVLASRRLGNQVGRVATSLDAAVQPLLAQRRTGRPLDSHPPDLSSLRPGPVFHRKENLF